MKLKYLCDVVTLEASISLTDNSLSTFHASGSTYALLGNTRLITVDGKGSFDITKNDNYTSKGDVL